MSCQLLCLLHVCPLTKTRDISWPCVRFSRALFVSVISLVIRSVRSSLPPATPAAARGHRAAGLFGYEAHISVSLGQQRHTTELHCWHSPPQHCPPFFSSFSISAFGRTAWSPSCQFNMVALGIIQYSLELWPYSFPPLGASSRNLPPDHLLWWYHRLWRAGVGDSGLPEELSPFSFLFNSRIFFVQTPPHNYYSL